MDTKKILAQLIEDVDLAEPSKKFNSADVEPTAVLPNVNCPSGTISPAPPDNIKSSAEVSNSMYALAVSPKNFTS